MESIRFPLKRILAVVVRMLPFLSRPPLSQTAAKLMRYMEGAALLAGSLLLPTHAGAQVTTYTYRGSLVSGSITVAQPIAPITPSHTFDLVTPISFSFITSYGAVDNTSTLQAPFALEIFGTDSAINPTSWSASLFWVTPTGQLYGLYLLSPPGAFVPPPVCGLEPLGSPGTVLAAEVVIHWPAPQIVPCDSYVSTPTPGNWTKATVSGNTGAVYVTNFKSNTVSVFDSSTNTLVSTIPVGTNPVGVVLRPDGAFAYVADQTFPGTVSVIDTQSNTVISTIPVGPFPTGIAVTPNGHLVYVVDGTSPGAVSVIDTTTNTVVATIPQGAFPQWVAVAPDGTFAYVTNTYSTPAYISVISTSTNAQVATIPVGQQPTGIAITPNGAFAYVPDGLADSVNVVELGTNTVVSTIPVGVNPGRVSITRDGAFAYVSNFNSGSVSVINTRTNTVATTVPVGIEPLDIAFTSDGLLAYVANSDFFGGQGNISVIGTLSRTVVATLASGNVPDGAAATAPPAAPTGCVFSLSPPTQVIGPQGGLGSFMINAAAGCQWQLSVNASWITILNPVASPGGGALSGSGSRKVLYAVNSDGGVARSGIITVGSLIFSVDQQGFAPTCSFSISPSHGTFASTGGNVTVVVTAPPGTACAWTATSNAPWLTVFSGASGSGSGTVTLHASPNPGALRSGTAIIAGQVFSATQSAAGVTACGALDVTSEVAAQPSGLNPIWFTSYDYSQTITVRNTSGSVIHGPVFIVTVGEPTHFGFGSDSGLLGGGLTTSCFSPSGDYLILVPGGDLQPGQSVGVPLVWFEQSPSLMPRYSTRVLSGLPTK